MAETRPRGEQLRFLSSKTGTHILDDYLEAVELGGRVLSDILSDLFDASSGEFRADLWEFRSDPVTSVLQYRIGDFSDPETGWIDAPNAKLPRWRGVFAADTDYAKLDLFTSGLDTYLVHTAHTSGAAPDPTKTSIIVDGTILETLKNDAEAAAASAAADAQQTGLDALATDADRQATAADALATAADRVATGQDRDATAADALATAADAQATAADALATDADRQATAADRAQTGLDAAATAADRAAAETARTAAQTAQAGAETAETNAETAETNASNHATTATTQAGIATTKAGEALTSANNAATAQTATEAALAQTLDLLDQFDDRYLGAKTSPPTTDNDGNPLVGGALYFDETLGSMQLWNGSAWVAAYVSSLDVLFKNNNLSDLADPSVARQNLGLGTAATEASASFAPAIHVHPISDVTGLQAALDDKAPTLNPTFSGRVYVRHLEGLTSDTTGPGPLYLNWANDEPVYIGSAVNTVWHAGNDGAGSGLDADLLDGQHASAFATAAEAVPSTSSAVAVDFNTLTTPGWQPNLYNGTGANGWGTSEYAFVLVLSYGGGQLLQVAFPYATTVTNTIRWRGRYQGSWGAWESAVNSADLGTAVPPGAIMHFARSTPPTGWLKANGAAVSRTTYAALFAAIGTTFGAGDGSTTFNLPDLRGEFVRGWDDARGVDSGRAFGSFQDGQNESHTHTASTNSTGAHTHSGSTSSDSHNHTGTTNTTGAHTHTVTAWGAGNSIDFQEGSGPRDEGALSSRGTSSAGNHSHTFTTSSDSHSHTFTTGSAGAHSHTVTINASGGTEARPRNVALLACIKY